MNDWQQALWCIELAIHKRRVEDQLRLGIGDLGLARQDSTWRCMGSKFRWMRSTPTESVSTRLKLLVCLAKTGVKAPANAIFDHTETRFPQFNSKRVGLVVGVA